MKRTAMKRKAPLARTSATPRARLKRVGKQGNILKVLDALLRKIILKRDVTCRRCGRGEGGGRGFALQAAHIYGKGKYSALRYELTNVILLCQPCHYWWHSNGFGREAADRKNEVRDWCVSTFGADYMAKLDYLTIPGVRSKPNRKLEKIGLEQMVRWSAETLATHGPTFRPHSTDAGFANDDGPGPEKDSDGSR